MSHTNPPRQSPFMRSVLLVAPCRAPVPPSIHIHILLLLIRAWLVINRSCFLPPDFFIIVSFVSDTFFFFILIILPIVSPFFLSINNPHTPPQRLSLLGINYIPNVNEFPLLLSHTLVFFRPSCFFLSLIITETRNRVDRERIRETKHPVCQPINL